MLRNLLFSYMMRGIFLSNFSLLKIRMRLCTPVLTLVSLCWSARFDFYEEILKVIPIWVKLPNLPLNCWGNDSLSRIGSLLGVPLYADECTSSQARISFARLLVEMDVTVPLPEVIWIEDGKGNVL